MQTLAPGARIPVNHTAPALDLDLLLGGLKPVVRGLNPRDVNALTSALLQIFQGQGQTLQSLLSKTSSFSNDVAGKNEAIEKLIENLNTVVKTLADQGGQFSGSIDRLERLISGLSKDRDTIGDAIQALDNGTASVAELLGAARPPLAGTIDQLNRLAPLVYNGKGMVDDALQQVGHVIRGHDLFDGTAARLGGPAGKRRPVIGKVNPEPNGLRFTFRIHRRAQAG